MTRVRRIDVVVTAVVDSEKKTTSWKVEVKGVPGATPFTIDAGLDGGRVYPVGTTETEVPPLVVQGRLPAAAIAKTVVELRELRATEAAVEALSQHLFATLLGPWWPLLTAELEGLLPAALPPAVEIALGLDNAPDLVGLPWELMRGDTGYIASGHPVKKGVADLVITRRTARSPIVAEPMVHPLRYLFVIGNELDDTLRAGAECMGMLRQMGPQVQDRVLMLASAGRPLADIVDEFRPHVVHVICHGTEGPGGTVLLELFDHAASKVQPMPAADLIESLVLERNGRTWCPQAVVLSACSSGTRLTSAGQGDLAAELVRAGIPVVVGMAAEISDLACRLFTRRLGVAVSGGMPLVIAAARGRRAALRDPDMPKDSFDWGLINLVMGDDVPSEIQVPPADTSVEVRRIVDRLDGYSLPIDRDLQTRRLPPFVGRSDVIAAFYELLSGRGAPVLCLLAYPPDPQNKVGKRRTMAELAAIAIRAGHVPVVVMPRAGSERGMPRTVADLGKELEVAIRKAREVFGLPDVSLAIEGALAGAAPILASSIRRPLAKDLEALHDAAFPGGAVGEVVVFVNDVHRFGDAIQPWFVDLLDGKGLGASRRIRVVTSYAMKAKDDAQATWGQHDVFIEELVTRTERTRLRGVRLDRLSSRLGSDSSAQPTIGVEERLAYQRLLLHPFRDDPPWATKRIFLNLRDKTKDLDNVLDLLQLGSGEGCPGSFFSPIFLQSLQRARKHITVLTEARDDDILKAGGLE